MKNQRLWSFSLAAALMATALAATIFIGASDSKQYKPLTQDTFIKIAKDVSPSVVSITVNGVNDSLMEQHRKKYQDQEKERERLNEFLNGLPFGSDRLQPSPFGGGQFNEDWFKFRQIGSGVILRSNGYIVTNSHVLGTAKNGEITVTLKDGREFKGEDVRIIDKDPLTDLAVLKVDAKNLPAMKWSDSESLQAGQWVLAVGDPLELRNSVTQGIISAVGRDMGGTLVRGYIQTTAIINPGNSGGPLVDHNGDIAGINVAISTRTGMWNGIGFAIPANRAKKVTDEIIEHKKVIRGFIGVGMWELDDELKEHFGYEGKGVLADAVTQAGRDGYAKDGPAKKGGMQINDIIAEIDDVEVENTNQMLREVTSKKVGEKVKFKVFRDGEFKTLRIEIAERPTESELFAREDDGKTRKPKDRPPKKALGIEVQGQEPEPPADNQDIVVLSRVEPDSAWAKAGLRPGDGIYEVNGARVHTIEDIEAALDKHEKSALVKFRRASLPAGRDHMLKVMEID